MKAQFASIKKFAKHKILDALKLAREAKPAEKPAPKRKFAKNKTNGKPAVEAKKQHLQICEIKLTLKN